MGNRRRETLGWAATAVLLAAHFVALVVLLGRRGLPQPAIINAVPIFVGFFMYFGIGLAGFGLLRFFRGEKARWLATVRRPAWWGEALLVVIGASLISLGYSTLKVAVPVLNPRRFDALLWEVDRWTLFGMSPNVLALEVIPFPWIFDLIDRSYGGAFLVTLMVSFSYILAHEQRRLKVGWLFGSAILWLGGAWLYLALPSIGPAYVFQDVWDGVRDMLPRTTVTQKELIQNYLRMIGMRPIEAARGVSLFYGVAAFPSLHLGFHAFVACWLQRIHPPVRLVGWLVVALMFVGSIVTGWHYMIDSIAGILLGWIAYRVALTLVPLDEKAAAEEEGMMRVDAGSGVRKDQPMTR